VNIEDDRVSRDIACGRGNGLKCFPQLIKWILIYALHISLAVCDLDCGRDFHGVSAVNTALSWRL
jgi:hypothetical protein